jgi:hypothetical protein
MVVEGLPRTSALTAQHWRRSRQLENFFGGWIKLVTLPDANDTGGRR